jgi:hypothetical protein
MVKKDGVANFLSALMWPVVGAILTSLAPLAVMRLVA